MPVPTRDLVERPQAFGFGCALDDHLFRLAVGPGRELSIETAPLEAPRVNTTSSPEEASEEFGLVFARSQFDGGSGQFRAHVEGSDPNRFYDSKNVSVSPADPGEFPEVTLLHTTASIDATANTGLFSDLVDGSLYVTSGNVLRRSDAPSVASPTFADDDPHAGETATAVTGVAGLGDEVYAALGANGIHRKASGTWSHWSDTQATRVWAVKGRIVASDGRSLYEVTSAGAAPSPLKTLAPGLEWTSVTDGGSFVLCAASDGYVYAFATDTGTLVLSAQTLFEEEQPYAVGQSQGIVAVGTRQATTGGAIGRLWVGVLTEAGQLADLQLVKQWGTTATATDESPRRIIGSRDAIYTAVPDGTDTYLWRYDLTTGGIARHLTVEGASGLVYGLRFVSGKAFVTVDGSGVWRETDTFASEGWLIGPLGDFYSSSDKSWVAARLETGTLASDQTVELHYSSSPDDVNDAASATWQRAISRTAGFEDDEVSIEVVSRQLAGMVKLLGDGTSSPSVRSFSFRAFQASGDQDVIISLPISVGDVLERRGRAPMRVSGLGAQTYASLKAKEGRPVLLTLYRPDEVVRGLVEYVGTPVQGLTRRGSVTQYAQVRIRGRRVSNSFQSSEGFGIGAWGIEVFG